jgi:hypothetical protein
MKIEREITVGAFKTIELVEVEDENTLTPMVEKNKPPEGTENLICIVAVNSIGEVDVISQVNSDKARWYLSEDGPEYIENDFDEPPGIYLVEFWIDGSRDYWGEYDSWSEFGEIIKYKIDVPDKRHEEFNSEAWRQNFETKVYENPGSEYPRVLIIINDSGRGFILDVINEDEAYKSIIKEAVYMMDELDRNTCLKPLALYEATISLTGDMVNLLDRDKDEDIKFSDIKHIPLVFGERVERISRKERNQNELEEFCKYIDELRMKEENIK